VESYTVYGVQVQWWYGHNGFSWLHLSRDWCILFQKRQTVRYILIDCPLFTFGRWFSFKQDPPFIIFCLPQLGAKFRCCFNYAFSAFMGWNDKRIINRGVWDKVRVDPVLKFFVVAITGYGMATLKVRCYPWKRKCYVHYTDWIIAHVHVGALAWNGFMALVWFIGWFLEWLKVV
jgi:cytochrome c oxidase cbb3-type subunit I/II